MNASPFCACGCGNPAPIADRNDRARGYVKGEPVRYVARHQWRSSRPEYVVEDHGFMTPCWVWQQGKTQTGYGIKHVRDASRKTGWRGVAAHRVYWEDRYGPIAAGKELDHHCRVRACVNPDHLEPVTHAVNVQRGLRTSERRREQLRADAQRGYSDATSRALLAFD